MRKELVRKSKLLSLVLRHEPSAIGLSLDSNGWADVGELLAKAGAAGTVISLEELKEIVETNEKRRFHLDSERSRIRANQGHSIDVDVEIPVSVPPDELYHGTALKSVDSILSSGLLKQNRQHVHLSSDVSTARMVGSRHGSPVVFKVASGMMHRNGHRFYLSQNGVWLADEVPVKYLQRL
jgi:putative RNA 2'-phosphotransferase